MNDDFWALWKEREADWKGYFAHIDSAIGKFVAEIEKELKTAVSPNAKVEILRYRWDAPDRLLVYPSPGGGGIWDNIHLLILGEPGNYFLRFGCAAWRDVEHGPPPSPRTRLWCHSNADSRKQWQLDLQEFSGPTDLTPAVERRLFEIYKTVRTWQLPANSDRWSGVGLEPELSVTIA